MSAGDYPDAPKRDPLDGWSKHARAEDGPQFSNCGASVAPRTHSDRLVVLVPSLVQTTWNWRELIERLRNDPVFSAGIKTDWLCFDHHLGYDSRGHLSSYAKSLAAEIDGYWRRRGGYKEVVLVGHSVGGLLVREAYVLGRGWDPAESFEPMPWADSVSRIVLFASTNRGFDVGEFRSLAILRAAFRWLPTFSTGHLVVEDILNGADFISNLRISWIKNFDPYTACRRLQLTPGPQGAARSRALLLQSASTPAGCGATASVPIVVQLLGANDAVVHDKDSRDILTMSSGGARQAVELIIPNAAHGDLYQLRDDAESRYAIIRRAFVEPRSTLITRAPTFQPDSTVRQVVFLLHGIRAATRDKWQSDLSRIIQEQNRASCDSAKTTCDSVVVVQPEYGYFSALRFALPNARRANVPWFQDKYTEVLARYPLARMSIVAHSNGTFMLGEALKHVPAMTFENVSLAGSVLPTSFPWDDLIMSGQVKRVRNDAGAGDWAVAILSNGVHSLLQPDVGTGGFDGFGGTNVTFVAWHQGSHGAAFSDENMPSLARFALGLPDRPPTCTPKSPLPSCPPPNGKSPDGLRRISRLIPWVTPPLFVWGGYEAIRWSFQGGHPNGAHILTIAVPTALLSVVLDAI
jgi:alpha-beta hydrolase superfamily lysophospholipase